MFRRLLLLLTALAPAVAALGLAVPAQAGGPTIAFGAAEDIVRSPDLVTAKARMTLFRLAGFTSIRVTSQWLSGETAPSDAELAILRNVDAAAALSGVRIYLSVYPAGSKSTPLTPEAVDQFVAYLTTLAQQLPDVQNVIIGNEPNTNRFWLPQFNADGSDAAAPAYLTLLARSYDALKAIDPATKVWGGALAPRGIDRPGTGRDTHSPVAFLKDMGTALRASGRTLPIMDGLAFHPYADSSGQSPDTPHPSSTTIGLADYDRLVRTLTTAFGSTVQLGATLPVLYDEFGVESKVPAGKAKAYTGAEPTTTKPVDEVTQGAYYARALQLAFCQPTVAGILLFHSQDESALASWQSGVYYADGTPKTSLFAVRDALDRARGGSIARCDGMALTVTASKVHFPSQAELTRGKRDARFTCSLDCAWELRATSASTGAVRARIRGYGQATKPVLASLKGRKLGTGQIRFSLALVQPVNPGDPWTRESAPLRAG